MKTRNFRLCIYPKDIQRITGKSERYSRSLLIKIKASIGKDRHQLITVEELAAYLGLPSDAVRERMLD